VDISLVTPAGKHTRAGNWTTAARWARILRCLGHRVNIAETDEHCDADMLIAVHAWRSRASIERFGKIHPDRPLVVCLAGTDIYGFQHSHPHETLKSMELAGALVCLHDLVHLAIPKRFHRKLRVIHQSALPLAAPRQPSVRTFDICVIGHLRDEKDPLRAAYAARLMPAQSRLRIIQLGKAHNEKWAALARKEMTGNDRFIWRGEVSGGLVRRQLSRSQVMVISSLAEGGANVISESVVAGVPVIASSIEGNMGLMGTDYAGTYPAEDTAALAALLMRAESEPRFLAELGTQCDRRAPLFSPDREMDAWRMLLLELSPLSRAI
jgi:putative glycosyltransferase (TIGR04348 family)